MKMRIEFTQNAKDYFNNSDLIKEFNSTRMDGVHTLDFVSCLKQIIGKFNSRVVVDCEDNVLTINFGDFVGKVDAIGNFGDFNDSPALIGVAVDKYSFGYELKARSEKQTSKEQTGQSSTNVEPYISNLLVGKRLSDSNYRTVKEFTNPKQDVSLSKIMFRFVPTPLEKFSRL